MDFVIEALLAIVSIVIKSTFAKKLQENIQEQLAEKLTERLTDGVFNQLDNFLESLRKQYPDLATAIENAPENPPDYDLLLKLEEVAKKDSKVAQSLEGLASSVKNELPSDLLEFLQTPAKTEVLKSQPSSIQTFINTISKTMVDIETIRSYLPDATNDQAKDFVTQLERLEGLKNFFRKYPDEYEGYEQQLVRAVKALNYQQPYRIAVIGLTGVGKSTLLNALLGKDLLLTKIVGEPATGAVLEIFLHLLDGEEKAVVKYRDESEIKKLINDFLKKYEPNAGEYDGELDLDFSDNLKKLEPPNNDIPDELRKEFIDLRNTLVDIVRQYANNSQNSLKSDFLLSNPSDVEELKELIDEHSQINKGNSTSRCIGLIKTVTYYYNPKQNVNGVSTLQLPDNVCLIDLPGLDGTPLHDIIIKEGIKNADAVIIIQLPKRFKQRGEIDLLHRVGKDISIVESAESGDRIFFVLNARDSIMSDEVPPNLPDLMGSLRDEVVTGYTKRFARRGGEHPYFLISAWGALQAQKAINGEEIKDKKTYDGIKLGLDVPNGSDQNVLEASQVPKLIEEINKLARDRINGQIRDGKSSIDQIINPLYQKYQRDKNQLPGLKTSSKTNTIEWLEKRRNKLIIFLKTDVRTSLLKSLETWRNPLVEKSKLICNDIDEKLQRKIPLIWDDAENLYSYRTTGQKFQKINYEAVLGDIEAVLWDQLALSVPSLADSLTQFYKKAIDHYKLAEEIEKYCCGSLTASELKLKLDKEIEQKMSSKMVQLGSRIALTVITDTDQIFLNTSTDGQQKNNSLIEILEKIPPNYQVNPKKDFDPFIVALRLHYEPEVSGFCIKSLLNAFKYEIFRIEEFLVTEIKEVFTKLITTDDPVVQSKIEASIKSDPELEERIKLESKIADLKPILDKSKGTYLSES